MIIETQLWEVIKGKLKEAKEQGVSLAVDLDVPLCIGFKKKIPKEEFKALVDDIIAHQQEIPGLSFKIRIYANEQDKEAVNAWLAEVEDISAPLAEKGHFVLIDEWRKEHQADRETAAYAYEELYKKREKTLEKMWGDDSERFIKMNPREIDGEKLNEETHKKYAKEYIKQEVIDCIALMERQDKPAKSQVEQSAMLKILYYDGKLYDSIGHAIKAEIAGEMGYKPGSLIHTNKTKYKVVDEVLHKVKIPKPSPNKKSSNKVSFPQPLLAPPGIEKQAMPRVEDITNNPIAIIAGTLALLGFPAEYVGAVVRTVMDPNLSSEGITSILSQVPENVVPIQNFQQEAKLSQLWGSGGTPWNNNPNNKPALQPKDQSLSTPSQKFNSL